MTVHNTISMQDVRILISNVCERQKKPPVEKQIQTNNNFFYVWDTPYEY